MLVMADEGSNRCASQYLNECHWYSPWNAWPAGYVKLITGLPIGFCQALVLVANWSAKRGIGSPTGYVKRVLGR